MSLFALVATACTTAEDVEGPFEVPMLGVTVAGGDTAYRTAETALLLAPGDGSLVAWEGKLKLAVPTAAELNRFQSRFAKGLGFEAADWWYALDGGVEAKALIDSAGAWLGWLAVADNRLALVMDVDGDGLVDYYEDGNAASVKRYVLNEAGMQLATSIRQRDRLDGCRGGDAFIPDVRASLTLACDGVTGSASAAEDGLILASKAHNALPLAQGHIDDWLEFDIPPALADICTRRAPAEPPGSPLSEDDLAEVEQFREDAEQFGLATVFYGALSTDVFPLRIPNPFRNAMAAKLFDKIGEKVTDEAAQREALIRLPNRTVKDFERLMLLNAVDRLGRMTMGHDTASSTLCEEASLDEALGLPPAGPLRASAHQDPHLATFDGLRYSLMSVGEFVALRSLVDDLELQLRFVVGGPAWSGTAAAVVGVDGHRVAIYLDQFRDDDGHITAYIDGLPQPLESDDPVTVGSAVVQRVPPMGMGDSAHSNSVLITSDDGSQIRVDSNDRWLNVSVALTDARAAHVEGLFGNANGDPDDDLIMNESEIVTPEDHETLHRQFADSWRVTNSTSLFDYFDGEGTDHYTLREHPIEFFTLADLEPDVRAAAEAACHAAGVEDPAFFDECVMDVALTGDVTVAQAARQAEVAHLPPNEFTVALGDTIGPGVPVPGAGWIEETGARDSYRFSGRVGQQVVIDVVSLGGEDDSCGQWDVSFRLLEPGGDELSNDWVGNTGCRAYGPYRLPRAGTYTLAIEGGPGSRALTRAATGAYQFRLLDKLP